MTCHHGCRWCGGGRVGVGPRCSRVGRWSAPASSQVRTPPRRAGVTAVTVHPGQCDGPHATAGPLPVTRRFQPARADPGQPARQRAAALPPTGRRCCPAAPSATGSSCASSTAAPASPRPTGTGSSCRSSDSAIGTNTTGIGLGLTLSRGLAEAMGGTLEPENTPGGGLTMVLPLPAAPAPASRPRRVREEVVES